MGAVGNGCRGNRAHQDERMPLESPAVTRSLPPQPRFLEARLDPAGQARGWAALGLLLWPTRAGDSDDGGGEGWGELLGQRWQSSNRRERFVIVHVGYRDGEKGQNAAGLWQRMGWPRISRAPRGLPPSPPPRRFLPNRDSKICLLLCSCQEIFPCCSSPGAESGPAFTAASSLVEMGMGFHWDLSRMGQHQSKSLWHSELSGVTLGQCPVPRKLRVTNWADPAALRAGSCVPWALGGVGLPLCPPCSSPAAGHGDN